MSDQPPSNDPQRRSGLLPLFLALACIGSGVAVVQIKHESRALTDRLDTLRRQRDHLDMEWAQLQLEQATLDGHGRVEQLAQQQFDMVEPKDYVIVPQDASAAPMPSSTPAAAVTP